MLLQWGPRDGGYDCFSRSDGRSSQIQMKAASFSDHVQVHVVCFQSCRVLCLLSCPVLFVSFYSSFHLTECFRLFFLSLHINALVLIQHSSAPRSHYVERELNVMYNYRSHLFGVLGYQMKIIQERNKQSEKKVQFETGKILNRYTQGIQTFLIPLSRSASFISS